jgi:hypothetical protein
VNEHPPQDAPPAAPLAAHAAECEACQSAPLPIDRIAMLLDGAEVSLDTTVLSARVMVRLRRELTLAGGVPWRAVVSALVRALPALPAVVACDTYALRTAYVLGKAILPAPLVAYVVLSYGALLLLFFGLTYAAVPVLVARQGPTRTVAG